MKLLLDTHIWLWLILDPAKLPEPYASALADPANQLFLSVASAWEIGIKQQTGKLSLGKPLETFLSDGLKGVEVLDICLAHVTEVNKLPLHHRDPFDRIIVAQAITEGLTLLTVDALMAPYGASILASTNTI